MTAELWIPETAERTRARVRKCLTCGREFPFAHLHRFVNHVKACEDGASEEHVKLQQSNVFTGFADPEAREWISKRIAEGKPATKRGRPA